MLMMIIQVFSQHDLQVSTPLGSYLAFGLYLNIFFRKMYVTITDIMWEKRIDLACLIQGKEVAVISMFSNNVQYRMKESLKVMLTN